LCGVVADFDLPRDNRLLDSFPSRREQAFLIKRERYTNPSNLLEKEMKKNRCV
jgi:hypothetical protein